GEQLPRLGGGLRLAAGLLLGDDDGGQCRRRAALRRRLGRCFGHRARPPSIVATRSEAGTVSTGTCSHHAREPGVPLVRGRFLTRPSENVGGAPNMFGTWASVRPARRRTGARRSGDRRTDKGGT